MLVSSGNSKLNKMLTVNEVADLLQVHTTTIRRWEREGHLKSYRLGPKGSIRFKNEDITEFIDSASNLPASNQ